MKDRLCRGQIIESFENLQDAKKACDKSLDCGCVSEYDDEYLTTNKGTQTVRVEDNIAYVRRARTKGIHSNILILKS